MTRRRQMNKINFFTFLFGILSCFAIPPFLFAAETTGTSITKVQGNASIIRNGQTLSAQKGQSLEPNDVIKTNAAATVDFATNGISGTRVFSSTEVVVAEPSKESMTLKLKSGSLILNVEKLSKGSVFRVETPTAIAAVRGTQFSSRVDLPETDHPTSSFAVRDGSVDVLTLGTNETFTLNEGDAIDIPKDITNPLSIRNALGSELSALDQASSIHTCG